MSGTVLVTDTMTEEVIGRIGNLSPAACLLIASKPLVEDALYQFQLRLTRQQWRADRRSGLARALDRRRQRAGQSWVGLRFLGLSTETTQRLRRWAEAAASRPEVGVRTARRPRGMGQKSRFPALERAMSSATKTRFAGLYQAPRNPAGARRQGIAAAVSTTCWCPAAPLHYQFLTTATIPMR